MRESLSKILRARLVSLRRYLIEIHVLAAKRLGSRQCNIPVHQGRPEIDAATLVPLILATILVLNRMAAKLMRLGGGWGWDDYTIIAAYVSAS